MVRCLFSLTSALVFAATVTSANAGIILQNTGSSAIQINFFEPIGQSFTAEDSSIKFAFYYQAFNPQSPNGPIELKMVSGDGTGGATLASVSFSLADNFNGFWDVDFAAVALTIGDVYTAVLSIPGTSPRFGVYLNDNGNPYAGGRAYWANVSQSVVNDASDDMRFRITPNANVPEPGALSLVALGMVGLWANRRRQVTSLPSA